MSRVGVEGMDIACYETKYPPPEPAVSPAQGLFLHPIWGAVRSSAPLEVSATSAIYTL